MENQIKDKSDAGWNDPPMFSYSDRVVQSSNSKRNNLNKRVAFPMNSSVLHQTPSIDPTVLPTLNPNIPPPPKSSTTILPSESCIKSSDETLHNEYDYKEVLNHVMNNLRSIILETEEFKTNETKKEAIMKRLQIMKDMWLDDKLVPEIHNGMLKLCEALKTDKKEVASEIQVSLMVDYPRQCSTWIAAIRQLINAKM